MSEYKLVREIGRGGMGTVWYGIRQSDGAECAIKCLLAKFVSIPEYREFFDSEARAMKRLNHPSVVKIMGDTFTDAEGNLYLPMEYIQGETIEHKIKQTGQPFSEKEAVRIMCEVLDAFAYIHSQGQIHRDIKPSNIMLRPDGRICVIDFGIAKDMKTSTGKTVGRQVGTHGYMSPEQIDALNIDHRTDIYSLGCFLFYMLTARHAITKRANDYETMCAIQREAFPSVCAINPMVSRRIEDIIYKATDKDMRRRFQNAAEFKVALLHSKTSAQPHDSLLRFLPDQDIYTKMVGVWSVSVGRTGQDINIPNQYVSTRHLQIQLESSYSTGLNRITRTLTLTDHSTNGTGLDGKYVHNATEVMPYDFLAGHTQHIPEILLAGREECRLDWKLVEDAILRKMSENIPPIEQTVTADREEEQINENEVTRKNQEKKTYLLVVFLSFVFPIVGWILYGANHKEDPIMAHKAFVAAWFGFAVSIILSFIIFN